MNDIAIGACVAKPFKRSPSLEIGRLKLAWNAITFPEGDWMLRSIGRLFIAWRTYETVRQEENALALGGSPGMRYLPPHTEEHKEESP